MVKRSKRSLHPSKIDEIQKEVRDFQWKVRGWAAEVPLSSTVYIGLDPLNHSLELMNRILNGEKEGSGYSRPFGAEGME